MVYLFVGTNPLHLHAAIFSVNIGFDFVEFYVNLEFNSFAQNVENGETNGE